jgi:hypothetical protein
MAQIMVIVEWVKANWVQIAQVITSVIGVASIIVKMTPNQKDDAVLGKIIAFIGKYIALNPEVKK